MFYLLGAWIPFLDPHLSRPHWADNTAIVTLPSQTLYYSMDLKYFKTMVRQFKQLGEGKLCFYSKSSVEYCSKALKVKVFCVVSNTPVEQEEKTKNVHSIWRSFELPTVIQSAPPDNALKINGNIFFWILSYPFRTDTQVNLIQIYISNDTVKVPERVRFWHENVHL